MKIMEPELLLEQYRELLRDEKIESLPLVISGSSMSPFLAHGRDTVYLSRLTGKPKRGDVVLYRRDSGAYILHRVYRVEGDTYTMLGDAQCLPEPGIRDDQIIAIMTRALRKGKPEKPGTFWWEFFEKAWIRMVPVRRIVMRIYGKLFH